MQLRTNISDLPSGCRFTLGRNGECTVFFKHGYDSRARLFIAMNARGEVITLRPKRQVLVNQRDLKHY